MTPVECLLNFIVVLFDPLFDIGRKRYADNVDDIHCDELAMHNPAAWARHTVVGSNQLVMAVVWLTTACVFLALHRAFWKLLWPVHPIDAGIDVMLVTGTDLQDARNPIVLRL